MTPACSWCRGRNTRRPASVLSGNKEMQTPMRKTKWFTMAAAVTLSATLAVAAPHGGGEGKGNGRHGKHGRGGQEFSQRFAQKLNLTDAQQQQIRVLQEGFKERTQAFRESSKATRQEF